MLRKAGTQSESEIFYGNILEERYTLLMRSHRICILDKSIEEEYALSEPNERKGADQDAEGSGNDGRPDGQGHVYLYVYLYA